MDLLVVVNNVVLKHNFFGIAAINIRDWQNICLHVLHVRYLSNSVSYIIFLFAIWMLRLRRLITLCVVLMRSIEAGCSMYYCVGYCFGCVSSCHGEWTDDIDLSRPAWRLAAVSSGTVCVCVSPRGCGRDRYPVPGLCRRPPSRPTVTRARQFVWVTQYWV